MHSKVVWFTGLSGAGKTTLAKALTVTLEMHHVSVTLIDADEFRKQYCNDLGFSASDRHENLMRITQHAAQLSERYDVVIVAAIAPFQRSRDQIRKTLGSRYMEVFVDTPLAVCESRDVKGLYKRARNGELREFTGISSPYERPVKPDVHLKHPVDIEQALRLIMGRKQAA